MLALCYSVLSLPRKKNPWCRWPNISNAMQLHWSCTSWGGNLLARLAQRSLGTTNVEDFPCHDWRGHIGGKSKNSLCTLRMVTCYHPATSTLLHHCTSMFQMGWHHLRPSKIGPKTLRSRSAPIPGLHSILAVCPPFHRRDLGKMSATWWPENSVRFHSTG